MLTDYEEAMEDVIQEEVVAVRMYKIKLVIFYFMKELVKECVRMFRICGCKK